MNNPRHVAVSALLTMDQRDAWSNLTLDNALEHSTLSPQDRGFASALFYGTLSRKITLKTCIEAHSKRPIDKIDKKVLYILMTALYQLLYMDRVPDHAAVDEAVSLTRQMKVASASGFVNGILRSFLRGKKEIPLPKGETQRLSVLYSCPVPLIKHFTSAYGKENTLKILEESLKAPTTFLRVNPLKTTSETLAEKLKEEEMLAVPHPTLANCLIVREGAATMSELLNKGHFHIQDYSSQTAAHAVKAKPDMRVLDTCAAPGGKTFILAQEMENTGELVATDLHEHRLESLKHRAQLLSLTNITTYPLDMKQSHEFLGLFDRVLCDVPCSGLGVIRRRPEIKYKNLKEFKRLPAIQKEILQAGGQHTASGGRLVYSTCTLSPKENQNVVDAFLEENPQFSCHSQNTIFPDAQGADGFFIAILEKD